MLRIVEHMYVMWGQTEREREQLLSLCIVLFDVFRLGLRIQLQGNGVT